MTNVKREGQELVAGQEAYLSAALPVAVRERKP